jgi:hypothetical protein
LRITISQPTAAAAAAAPAYDATVAVLKAYQATGIAADGAQLAKRMSTVLYEGEHN